MCDVCNVTHSTRATDENALIHIPKAREFPWKRKFFTLDPSFYEIIIVIRTFSLEFVAWKSTKCSLNHKIKTRKFQHFQKKIVMEIRPLLQFRVRKCFFTFFRIFSFNAWNFFSTSITQERQYVRYFFQLTFFQKTCDARNIALGNSISISSKFFFLYFFPTTKKSRKNCERIRFMRFGRKSTL